MQHPFTNMREALRKRRIFQYEAASQLGISETRLNRICSGRLEATPKEKKALAKLLGESVEALFGTPNDGGGAQ